MSKIIHENLKNCDQEHLIQFLDELNADKKNILNRQLDNINFDQLKKLIKSHVTNTPVMHVPKDLIPASFFPHVPKNENQKKLYIEAAEKGKELLSLGQACAFTVAGGQGTRLGYDGAKGTFPITPVKGKSLFQYFGESIKRASIKFGSDIPWYIMTSDMNDAETQEFFLKNNFFGLSENDVMFFKQGTMPVMGQDGKILLDEKHSISLAPDGHGGSLSALRNSGALKDMKKRGIEYISYFQVDNPLVSVVNPLLLGLHCIEKSEMSSIALSKTNPFEKLGNLCMSDGKLMIIEYSDLPDELAEKRDESGKLCFVAGSPAIHVLSRMFVERLTDSGNISLPWHRADKKVSFIGKDGEKNHPDAVNAVKLETFIFDALPLADRTILLEAKREDEFAPTKNKTGVDSIESCRQMLIERDAKLIEQATGIEFPVKSNGALNCTVELSPLKYFDKEDVAVDAEMFKANIPAQGDSRYYG